MNESEDAGFLLSEDPVEDVAVPSVEAQPASDVVEPLPEQEPFAFGAIEAPEALAAGVATPVESPALIEETPLAESFPPAVLPEATVPALVPGEGPWARIGREVAS